MASKEEIEYSIKDQDDFVKIDKLKRYLKSADSLDTKKYIQNYFKLVKKSFAINLYFGISSKFSAILDSIKNILRSNQIPFEPPFFLINISVFF